MATDTPGGVPFGAYFSWPREESCTPGRSLPDWQEAPWPPCFAERARAELRATGARPARRDPAASEGLTAQERQIAAEVALGRSNREVAAAMFLSPKTVEMHLTRVYRKLGLRSRAQLVRLAAEGGLGEGIDSEASRS